MISHSISIRVSKCMDLCVKMHDFLPKKRPFRMIISSTFSHRHKHFDTPPRAFRHKPPDYKVISEVNPKVWTVKQSKL